MDSMGYPTNPVVAYAKGQSDARRDLTNGVLSVKTCGLPPMDRPEYARLLEARCNVRLDPLAACIVTEGLRKYIDGYNEVASACLEQKFGTNIFNELDIEAAANYQKSFEAMAGPGNYTIRSGDTLTKIAREHGVSLKVLQDANPKLDPTRLQIGQKIIIPLDKTKDNPKQPQPTN